jgi:hypothetical protein
MFGKDGGYQTHRVYLKITKPFRATDINLRKVFKTPLAEQWNEWMEPRFGWQEERINDFNNRNKYERDVVYQYAKNNGYDGVILPNEWDLSPKGGNFPGYAVFNNTQIFNAEKIHGIDFGFFEQKMT